MKILMAHPTGNANVRAVIKAFEGSNMLAEFNTTIAIDADSKWLKCLSPEIREQLLRRQFSMMPKMLKSHPMAELARILLPKVGLQRYTTQEHSWASIDSVYRKLDQKVASRVDKLQKQKQISAVYGYEDGSLQTFKRAKELGLTCIYDLPIAYWHTGRLLMQEEAERLPEWAETLGGGIKDSDEKLERKTQEMQMADVVVTPGGFVKESIPDWAKMKQIIVSPFGSPKWIAPNILDPQPARENRLRVLFAGSLSQRKGLGDLFNALKLLNSPNIELVVMGSLTVPLAFYQSQLPSFTYLSNRPHHKVLELMRSCDVFCLPSIVEGRALVMQEAMSQGLPIIITPNTGGEDLIIEGVTGFLVPIRSPEAIANKLSWFLENRNKIKEMGRSAQEHAANYTWDAYGSNIVKKLLEHRR
jgi:glycosyltransferase involved in cell wall biosynthesis